MAATKAGFANKSVNDTVTASDINSLKLAANGAIDDAAAAQAKADAAQPKQTGYGLSQENYTTAEKTKLAGLDSNHFRGNFTSANALPAGNAGDYAYVGGSGVDEVQYIWDATDSKWVPSQSSATAETPASIKTKYESNADTNAYTNSEKAKVANLSGVNTGDETAATIKSKLGVGTLSGNNTGDQDLSNYVTTTAFNSALSGKQKTLIPGAGITLQQDGIISATAVVQIQAPVMRSGGVIAFDTSSVYNTDKTPFSGSLSYDLAGAQFGVEVYVYYNGTSLNLPSGTGEVIGAFNAGGINKLKFIYLGTNDIQLSIESNGSSSSGGTITKSPTAETSVSNAIATPVPGFDNIALNSGSYIIEGFWRINSGAGSGGLKMSISGPSDILNLYISLYGTTSTTTTYAAGVVTALDTLDSVAFATSASANNRLQIWGKITLPTAGILKFNTANVTAGATGVAVMQDSFIKITKL